MIKIEDIEIEIMNQGNDPNDFNIEIFEGGYKIFPKSQNEKKISTLENENSELKSTAQQMSADFQALTDLLAQRGVI